MCLTDKKNEKSMLFLLFCFFTTKLFREISKEIMFQHPWKLHQGLCVYPIAFEDIIYGIAMAVQLFAQPSNTYAVFLYILFYKPSYMKIFAHLVFSLRLSHYGNKKGVHHSVAYDFWGIRQDPIAYKHIMVHARGHEL